MITSVFLAKSLRTRIETEARLAFPRECCGLIEGTFRFDVVEALAVHPTRNLATAADRFEIDPAEHIRLLRAARQAGNEIVGCYHSHPDGRPDPSGHDREYADGEFLWLIAVVSEGAFDLRAFAGSNGQFAPVALVENAKS